MGVVDVIAARCCCCCFCSLPLLLAFACCFCFYCLLPLLVGVLLWLPLLLVAAACRRALFQFIACTPLCYEHVPAENPKSGCDALASCTVSLRSGVPLRKNRANGCTTV